MDQVNAKELMRRYRQGERDFRGMDLSGESLRGMNLKGIDLTGANLSKTDLRGTNFTRAELVDTNFNYTRTGFRRRWILPIGLLIIFLLGSVSLVLGFLVAGLVISLVDPTRDLFRNVISPRAFGFTGLVAIIVSLFLYYRKGNITLLGLLVVGFSGAAASFGIRNFTIEVIDTFINVQNSVEDLFISILTVMLFFAFTSFTVLSIKRSLAGDPRDKLIRNLSVWIISLGGTNFCYANLTRSKFSYGILKGSYFKAAVMYQTSFHLARGLHLSRVHKTILADRTVLNLLVSLKPEEGKSYTGLLLQGANLSGADLPDVDFTEANLSNAILSNADLQRAIFAKTQAIGTDFHGADLTAACIESWNIDNTTKLDGAICSHVYLLTKQQERRPHAGDFAPGEFTKLFEEVLNTIDLIFREGIDWQAFLQTFQKVREQHGEADLALQSIENKADGVMVVRLNADPSADKRAIHAAFTQGYDKALAAADQKYRTELQAVKIEHQAEIIALHRERSADVKEIALKMAQQSITVQATAVSESKAMEGSDNSQTIKIGGDFNADNSVVNFGTISGQVTNQINQLGVEQSELQDLLKQLQTSIETDMDLSDTDKTDALEQVEKLAEAAKDPQENQSRAKRAIGVIKDITQGLAETNKLVDVCKTLLPAIGTLFLL